MRHTWVRTYLLSTDRQDEPQRPTSPFRIEISTEKKNKKNVDVATTSPASPAAYSDAAAAPQQRPQCALVVGGEDATGPTVLPRVHDGRNGGGRTDPPGHHARVATVHRRRRGVSRLRREEGPVQTAGCVGRYGWFSPRRRGRGRDTLLTTAPRGVGFYGMFDVVRGGQDDADQRRVRRIPSHACTHAHARTMPAGTECANRHSQVTSITLRSTGGRRAHASTGRGIWRNTSIPRTTRGGASYGLRAAWD